MKKSAHAAEAVLPPAARRQARMIEPAILLLLLERDGVYGYELREEIAKVGLTDAEVDASAIYRCLRWLEKQEQVRSKWDTADGGAPKRRYELTEFGVKSLSLWADLLRRRRESLSKYLVRYREGAARYRRRRKI